MHDLLKAIADPIRLRAAFLLTFGELCICDLQILLEHPQTTISRHMQYMKKHGWVASQKRGRWVYYSLQPPCNDFHAGLIKNIAQMLRESGEFAPLTTKLHDHQINKACQPKSTRTRHVRTRR